MGYYTITIDYTPTTNRYSYINLIRTGFHKKLINSIFDLIKRLIRGDIQKNIKYNKYELDRQEAFGHLDKYDSKLLNNIKVRILEDPNIKKRKNGN